ncbi:MAG: hypothetical protein ABUJ93_11750 [Hyphomicrobium sp.]
MGKITRLNLLIVDQRLPRTSQKMHKLQVKIGKAAKTSWALHLALSLSPVGAAFLVALAARASSHHRRLGSVYWRA